MSKKYLQILALALAVAAGLASVRSWLFTEGVRAAGTRPAFTARMEIILSPASPGSQNRERVVAFASDGTEIVSESLRGRPVTDRWKRITRPDGHVALEIGPLGAKSTWQDRDSDVAARARLRQERERNGCLMEGKGQSVVGHEDYLGFPAVVIESPADPFQKHSVRKKEWFIPQLGCLSAQALLEVHDESGRVVGTTLRRTTSIVLGEPPKDLASITPSAVEGKPSELQRRYESMLDLAPCQDCEERARRLDSQYLLRHAR